MQDAFGGIIMDVLQNVTYLVLSVLGGYAVAWVKKKLGAENVKKIQAELAAHKDLAEEAVKYAQEKFSANEDKFDGAINVLAQRANKLGLNIDGEDLEVLIESALKKVKSEMGEAWNKSA